MGETTIFKTKFVKLNYFTLVFLNLQSMNEAFLHHLWKNKITGPAALVTVSGLPLQIIYPGEHNTDEGPDFFNSRVVIDGTTWAGNVEVHLKSSDWNKHGHQNNPAYNNVILHVVYQHDLDVFKCNGMELPTFVLKNAGVLFDRYSKLVSYKYPVPCNDLIHAVHPFVISDWITSLASERLQQKTGKIFEILQTNKNHWEETFYQLIARNFGFKTNAEPFERLARSLPLMVLAKNRQSLFQTEALLFGQAGLLANSFDHTFSDAYYLQLKKEYNYLRHKLDLKPIDGYNWKFLRLHPVNFPTVRIAQFASLIFQSSSLFSKVIECEKIEQVRELFDIEPSGYWTDHYLFGKPSPMRHKVFGNESFNNVLINTIVPLLFAYSTLSGNEYLKDRALLFLEQTPAEDNSKIKQWVKLQIKPTNAFESQALLQLFNEWCNKTRCMECRIGMKIIQGKEQ